MVDQLLMAPFRTEEFPAAIPSVRQSDVEPVAGVSLAQRHELAGGLQVRSNSSGVEKVA